MHIQIIQFINIERDEDTKVDKYNGRQTETKQERKKKRERERKRDTQVHMTIDRPINKVDREITYLGRYIDTKKDI